MNREDLLRLSNATNRMDGLYYRLSKVTKVSENTTALFYALSDGKPHSQKEISEQWFIPKTTLNSIVKSMIKEGYMILSYYHGKEKCITLTDSGQEYSETVLKPIHEAEDKVMCEMTDNSFIAEFEKFTQLLEQATIEWERRNEQDRNRNN